MFGDNGFFGRGRQAVNNTQLYETLGVDKNASSADIKRSFRNLAIQHHPDKGGDPETFKKIAKAYEVLSDADQRAAYDEYGESALDGSAPSSGGDSLFDLFSGMGGRGRRQQRRRARGEDIVFPMKVTLKDLYVGVEKKLRLTKNVVCAICDGVGGDKNHVQKCDVCNGQGIRVHILQIGPGMIQQAQSVCDVCEGQGKSLPDQYRCGTCTGKKTQSKQVTIECHIEQGMKHNERIKFAEMADEAPDTDTGDVIVILQQQTHNVFVRKGDDLFIRQTIALKESLCGFEFDILHLDDRVIRVQSTKGHIYRPGELKQLPNEGMPKERNHLGHGNLYIEFNIEFPENDSLSADQSAILMDILNSGSNPINVTNSDAMNEDDNIELVELMDVDIEAEKHKREQEAHKERQQDEEESDARQRVGCQQQ